MLNVAIFVSMLFTAPFIYASETLYMTNIPMFYQTFHIILYFLIKVNITLKMTKNIVQNHQKSDVIIFLTNTPVRDTIIKE